MQHWMTCGVTTRRIVLLVVRKAENVENHTLA